MGARQSEIITRADLAPELVRAHLARVISSHALRRCRRLRSLLGYLVEEVLRDGNVVLKEYHIGVAVFRKAASFDPRVDPMVRVEIGRLRRKLAAYYAAEGTSDQLEISVPSGSYAPVFVGRAPSPTSAPAPAGKPAARKAVAVPAFKMIPDSPGDTLASALAGQTAQALSRDRNVPVLAWHSVFLPAGRQAQIAAASADPQVGALLDGTIWRRRNTLRISAALVRMPDARLLWSQTYERPGNCDFEILVEVAAKIAADIVIPEDLAAPAA